MNLIMLFLLFVKFGLLCIGGGNVLMALYIEAFVEAPNPLMTHEEFGNLLAISQITPGPVGINTATFCGYRIAGVPGAVVATTGLLTPSFFILLTVLHYLNKWSRSNIVKGLMRGVAPASAALILTALVIFMEMSVFTGQIPWERLFPFLGGAGGAPVRPFPTIRPLALIIAVASTWAILKTRIQITSLILISALVGVLGAAFTG